MGTPAIREAGRHIDRKWRLWLALEAVIARNDRVGLVIDGDNRTFECGNLAQKRALYNELYWWLRSRSTEMVAEAAGTRPSAVTLTLRTQHTRPYGQQSGISDQGSEFFWLRLATDP